MRGTRIGLLALTALLLWSYAAHAIEAGAEPTVVLLVFDGFAPALIEPEAPPALARIQREGVFSHHLIPAFPSSDSVSKFTLSTGCRPATHGIVNEEFIDPQRGLYEGALDSEWMLACEHLGAAARRQGLRVATWDWFEDEGDDDGDPELRTGAVVRALQLPRGERPQLLIAHFDGPQDVVQEAGLRSDEARRAVVRIDTIVGTIMEAIEALPASASLTLIVATNHGLLPVWTEVNLTRILDDHDLDLEFTAAAATAFVYIDKPEDEQPAIRALITYQRQFQLYVKRGTPPEWNLRDDSRVGDLVLVANPPYVIESPRRWWKGTAWLASWLPELPFARPFVKAGAGYPPSVRGMPGVLYAWGSAVAAAGEITRLDSIDLHPTICRLLGISPGSPVDGSVVPLQATASPPPESE